MPYRGPREKLARFESKQLLDEELLCAVLGSGGPGPSGPEPRVALLARELLRRFENLDGVFSASLEELSEVSGIGAAKASLLRSVFEISRRLNGQRDLKIKVGSVEDAFQLFRDLAFEEQEVVSAAFLTSRHRLIRVREIFRGTLTHSPACPREILREALRANAARLLVAHNHPSGNAEPSPNDINFTDELEKACELVGIPLIDHIILGRGRRYFSFKSSPLRQRGHRPGEFGKRREGQ